MGEAVAVVVARDRYTAADAVEAIEADYEPLPPVLDMQRPRSTRARPRCTRRATRASTWPFGNGDIEAAFRDAPVVVERTFRQQRLIPCAMEPRAVVATCVGGEFTIWSATQIPHVLRVMLALVTGIGGAEHPGDRARRGRRFRIQAAGHRRGSAGDAGHAQARQAGQVDRVPQRGQHDRAPRQGSVAADPGRRRRRRPDPRARRRPAGRHGRLPDAGQRRHPAARRVHVQRDLQDGRATRSSCTGVFSTKMPTDAYRGAGLPEATFAIERIMDELAVELGMDPLELRERNWIKHEEFPFTTIAGLTYDSGNYEAATAKAKELFQYDELRREQAERTARNDPVRLGIGVSTFTEMCGLAPSRVLGSLVLRRRRLGERVDPDAADRQGRGGDRVERARPGPRDRVEPDRGRPARRPVRGHPGAARRHPDLAQGHGHLRIPVAGRGRHGPGRRVRQGSRQGQGDRRGHDRGLRRRPGVDAGAVLGPRRPGEGRHDRRDRAGHLRRAQPAGWRRAVAGLGRHLRSGQLLVPARHPPVRDRGGHRDRHGHDPFLRGGRRRRSRWSTH